MSKNNYFYKNNYRTNKNNNSDINKKYKYDNNKFNKDISNIDIVNNNNDISNNKIINNLTFNMNRTKIKNNNSNIQNDIENIRKICNKLSNEKYDKLKNELFCLYTIIINTYKIDDLEYINQQFFYILSSSLFYSNLYSQLFKDFSDKYINFNKLLINNYENFFNSLDNIMISKNCTFDEINKTNKHNDKIKSLILFYTNNYNNNLLDENIIIDFIKKIQDLLNNYLTNNINNQLCEEYTNILYIILSNSYKNLVKNKMYITIFQNIEKIGSNNLDNGTDISNKILFKHKDMINYFKC